MVLPAPHAAPLRSWTGLVELACRAGYAARGFLYLSVGGIALLTALHLAPKARGVMAALEAWGQWPAGLILLVLAGAGLWGFTGWRVLQAAFDVDRQGRRPKAVLSRIGQAISGLVYAAFAISTFELLDAIEDLHEVDDEAKTRAAIEQLLAMPGGAVLVIGTGAFVLACGVGNLVQAARHDFCRQLDCDAHLARRAALLGKAGYAARGLVFLTAGAFILLAGLHASASEAKGTGAALDWLANLPFGDAILAAVALGLIAFGLFGFVEARYRDMRLEQAVDR